MQLQTLDNFERNFRPEVLILWATGFREGGREKESKQVPFSSFVGSAANS